DKACLVPTRSNADVFIKRIHELLFNVIGSYKSAVSKSIHAHGLLEFAWQRSFHDRVIRNQNELNGIRAYIFINSINWATDRNNL
ncbi:MAG: transposase, partial [Candidatus Komeilibacteria bacterium]|nr:transposase [Candidatus Komeilibacteria bacterium]